MKGAHENTQRNKYGDRDGRRGGFYISRSLLLKDYSTNLALHSRRRKPGRKVTLKIPKYAKKL